MALAGPAANIGLVILAGLAIHAGIAAGIFGPPTRANFTHVVDAAPGALAEGLATFVSILFSLNLLLAFFNLLPVPPLDGNTAVGIFLKEKVALRFVEMTHHPSFTFIGVIIAWSLFDRIFSPLFLFGLSLLYPGLRYH